MNFRFLLSCSLVFLAACAAPRGDVEMTTKTISRAFGLVSSTTTSGDKVQIAGAAFESGGRVMICAAAAVDGGSTFESDWPGALLEATQILIGDEVIQRGAGFGARYHDTATLVGKAAHCVVTDKVWKAEYQGARTGLRVGRVQLKA